MRLSNMGEPGSPRGFPHLSSRPARSQRASGFHKGQISVELSLQEGFISSSLSFGPVEDDLSLRCLPLILKATDPPIWKCLLPDPLPKFLQDLPASQFLVSSQSFEVLSLQHPSSSPYF